MNRTMDVKEKLVELLKTNACPSPFMCDPTCRYYGYGDCFPDRFADHLIAHGVTVQDGKPLEAFLHPVDAYEGLKAKYLVFKADTGEKVENCFILRPDKDAAAVEALRAYANATDNKTLAEDIYSLVRIAQPPKGE